MSTVQIPQSPVSTPPSYAPPVSTPEPEKARRNTAKIVAGLLIVALGWAGGWFGTKALFDHSSHHGSAAQSTSASASQSKSADSQSHSGEAVAPDPTSEWRPVLLDGSASLRLPVGVSHESQQLSMGGGTVTIDFWEVRENGLHYMVGRTELPPNAVDGAIASKSAASGAFEKMGAENTSYTDTTINGAPAVVASGTNNGQPVFGAFVDTHNVLFEILVGGPNARSHDLDQVLNTFSTP
jgi:hypothetical protein